ncbi:uncharacterized protein YjcR [Sphingobium sp. B1D7B]|uniref:terminase large subunit domain-containing protein n=1 Tax=Sphingobium sp. B1D7B TaxID=2940578 RepID=UPI00222456D4|nr:terminase family protein [Sphingobium sp. B1D7B]MCW2405244.1 uncharacterized protein YjcR [Sphingobium sp. B1D7B]
MSMLTGSDGQAVPYDVRRVARSLYWRAYGVTEIAAVLGLKRTTVQAWKDRDRWEDDPVIRRLEDSCEMRLNALIFKEDKNNNDYKEIDALARVIERTARVRRYGEPGGHEGDLNPKVAARNAKPKKKAPKNLITRDEAGRLKTAFLDGLFGHQETWWQNISRRTRFLLKSRQIGATFYFAREALIRALETGNNQIFISASRAQANIFRQYIVEFVFAQTGKMLKGDPLVIDRGEDEDGKQLEPVTLYFLGTNYRTAQGYHGDVYIDECFWIFGFEQINKVASAIATQKRYHKTYFSTPSTIAHEAYPMWTGERFNRRRERKDQIKIDVSHSALAVHGAMGADQIWRHIVNLDDAIAGGFNLIDRAELELEYSVDEFSNLFLCDFVDDSKSSFPLSMLRPCMVDSWDVWKDFDPYALQPFGQGEVWIGYDPQESEDGDSAACVVVAPPTGPKGKFRVLEKLQWRGKDFEAQAAEIKKLCSKYRVTEIAIDTTGMGAAVHQQVVKFFLMARRIDYSALTKTMMVLKAKNVFTKRRIEFDAGWRDLAAALMSIHPQLTAGGKQMTYVARRSEATGHGDLAWALLHVLYCEPMDGGVGGKSSMEIM